MQKTDKTLLAERIVFIPASLLLFSATAKFALMRRITSPHKLISLLSSFALHHEYSGRASERHSAYMIPAKPYLSLTAEGQSRMVGGRGLEPLNLSDVGRTLYQLS
jgi:hypothetical protein